MPTNLPPEYFEVEKRYKAAESVSEKVATLEELISTIPKHKGTDKLRADLRRRLSKLKSSAQSKKGGSRHVSAYQIDREGAGQVVLIGAANVGKSALVAALTNAAPEVGPAPFTTWQPTPGMMPVENIQVQLVDTPAHDTAARSKGQCGFLGDEALFVQSDDVFVEGCHSESPAGLHDFVKRLAFGFAVQNRIFNTQVGS